MKNISTKFSELHHLSAAFVGRAQGA